MERFKSLTRYWWAMLILGVAIFVVGILIFTYPGESYIGMAALFAVLMLVSGIIEVVIAFTEKYMVGRGWAAVLGVLEIILGIILICSPAITAMSAASSELSLMWMTIITCVGLPLVLVYHVIIYRTFRGRVKEEDLAHY